MKVQNKTIAAIASAAALFSASAVADDFSTVINIEQGAPSVNVVAQDVVNPDITIQDYIDSANQQKQQGSGTVADTRSRWEAESVL